MKRRVPGLIKRIIAALSTKTNELRTRIMIFFLLHRDQSLLLEKFQTVVAGRRHAAAESLRCGRDGDGDGDGDGESFVMYMNAEPQVAADLDTSNLMDLTTEQVSSYTQENGEDRCIDLTDTLLKETGEEMKGRDNEESATMVKVVEDGRLEAGEEDIDHAADVFIERFRRQILLQKQLSLQEKRRNL